MVCISCAPDASTLLGARSSPTCSFDGSRDQKEAAGLVIQRLQADPELSTESGIFQQIPCLTVLVVDTFQQRSEMTRPPVDDGGHRNLCSRRSLYHPEEHAALLRKMRHLGQRHAPPSPARAEHRRVTQRPGWTQTRLKTRHRHGATSKGLRLLVAHRPQSLTSARELLTRWTTHVSSLELV